MTNERPTVVSIAGYDPSAGAGVLADCKTFEMHQVLGMSVCTSITYQHEASFQGVTWLDWPTIKKQLDVLFERYHFEVVKIGLIEHYSRLEQLILFLREKNPSIKIIWDPIVTASAGFVFHSSTPLELVSTLLTSVDLITPNLHEAKVLCPSFETPEAAAAWMSLHCAVLLKGGHDGSLESIDRLFINETVESFSSERILKGEKHGSGCVLSSSIAANLALGYTLEDSCRKSKVYISRYLSSTPSLLGYHYV